MEQMATILGKGSHPNNSGITSCGREYIISVNRYTPAKASRCLPRESVRETCQGLELRLMTTRGGLPALATGRLLFTTFFLNNTPDSAPTLSDLTLKAFIRCCSLTFSRRLIF